MAQLPKVFELFHDLFRSDNEESVLRDASVLGRRGMAKAGLGLGLDALHKLMPAANASVHHDHHYGAVGHSHHGPVRLPHHAIHGSDIDMKIRPCSSASSFLDASPGNGSRGDKSLSRSAVSFDQKCCTHKIGQ